MEKMTEWSFKRLVKEKTEKAAFKYLLSEKVKQSKIADIEYKNLEIQEYLSSGCCNVKLAKLIFKARSKTLDIKTQRKWKYTDILCSGCRIDEESGQEILSCKVLSDKNMTRYDTVMYSDFYSDNIDDIVQTGKILQNNLKRRNEILETGVT